MLLGLLITHYAPKQGFDYTQYGFEDAQDLSKKGVDNLFRFAQFFPREVIWDRVDASDSYELEEMLTKGGYDIVLLSGSAFDIDDDALWITREIELISEFILSHHDAFVFGICFGHQLLAKAQGGTLAVADRFFSEMIDIRFEDFSLSSYACHQFYVDQLPIGAQVKGVGPHDIPYFIEYSPRVYGIQSHPESIHCEYSPYEQSFWKQFFSAHLK